MQPRFEQDRPFIGRPLRNLWSRFEDEVFTGLREANGRDLGLMANRVMVLIDREGTRIGELARRASVTKQAMAEAVAVLEARGLVRREVDPDDRRAKRVVLTKDGAAALQTGRTIAEGVHGRWEERFGERDMARLVALLTKLDHVLDTP